MRWRGHARSGFVGAEHAAAPRAVEGSDVNSWDDFVGLTAFCRLVAQRSCGPPEISGLGSCTEIADRLRVFNKSSEFNVKRSLLRGWSQVRRFRLTFILLIVATYA